MKSSNPQKRQASLREEREEEISGEEMTEGEEAQAGSLQEEKREDLGEDSAAQSNLLY